MKIIRALTRVEDIINYHKKLTAEIDDLINSIKGIRKKQGDDWEDDIGNDKRPSVIILYDRICTLRVKLHDMGGVFVYGLDYDQADRATVTNVDVRLPFMNKEDKEKFRRVQMDVAKFE